MLVRAGATIARMGYWKDLGAAFSAMFEMLNAHGDRVLHCPHQEVGVCDDIECQEQMAADRSW